jgi:ribosomal protein S18 acetylase RimI-like enzyme
MPGDRKDEWMLEIARGDQLGEAYRHRIAEVLVTGFAEDFSYFSTDPGTLADLFEHLIVLERFYVVLLDGEPAAIASLTTHDEQCFRPRWHEFRRHLGLLRGLVAYVVVRTQFLGSYDGAKDGLAEIGFVATAPAHQGRGLGTALLEHLLALPDYREYVLEEIKDTNAAALALYAKLGFTVYKRRPERFAKRAGFSEYLSMKLVQG